MKKAIKTVGIREAKAQLFKLVDRASKGEPFIITKAGKSPVKVIPIDPPVRARERKLTKGTASAVPQQGGRVRALAPEARVPSKVRRLGFLSGQIAVPEDFDEMGSAGIRQLFEGKDEG
jgi:prevent-host-death family protein